MYDKELYHYGVIGMKWGIRRNRASKAFAKASKKANKIDKKASDKLLESAKLANKSMKMERRATSEKKYKKARKVQFKSNELNLESAKLKKKGAKWVKKMKKQFSTVNIKDISEDDLAVGKKYAYMLKA